MPQINTGEFRKGVKVLIDGEPYDMIEVNFVKPGKGQALYKTRVKNLLRGSYLDRTYKSGDSLEAADIRTGEGQFLYRDPSGYIFMDNESFEQYTVPESVCGDGVKFMKEAAICQLLYWNDQVIGVTPPQHVVMQVTYTEPAARGNTATNVSKPATVETGAVVQVPAFVQQGEMIKINAQTGEYVERVRE